MFLDSAEFLELSASEQFDKAFFSITEQDTYCTTSSSGSNDPMLLALPLTFACVDRQVGLQACGSRIGDSGSRGLVFPEWCFRFPGLLLLRDQNCQPERYVATLLFPVTDSLVNDQLHATRHSERHQVRKLGQDVSMNLLPFASVDKEKGIWKPA